MAGISKNAAEKVLSLLAAERGLNAQIGELAASSGISVVPIAGEAILTQNVPADLLERTAQTRYPALAVYCEKLSNDKREKFRRFSGTASLAIEVRHSQDRIEGLAQKLEAYVDAVAQVLDGANGDWGNGMFYGGGYEVTFGPVKHGGKNFIQTAKVTFEVGVSRN